MKWISGGNYPELSRWYYSWNGMGKERDNDIANLIKDMRDSDSSSKWAKQGEILAGIEITEPHWEAEDVRKKERKRSHP